MEVLLDFYQNQNCHAVHALTFLFRDLAIVLFHPTDCNHICGYSFINTQKGEKAPTVEPLHVEHVDLLWT